jgi:hypothetical protein
VQTFFFNYLLGYLFVPHSPHNQTLFSFFEFLEKLDLLTSNMFAISFAELIAIHLLNSRDGRCRQFVSTMSLSTRRQLARCRQIGSCQQCRQCQQCRDSDN